ncbi:MAG: hypothetical protein ABIN79_10190 [Marmoricola sp.]
MSTAVTLARHPLNTAANAAGLVKGTAQASLELLRGRSAEQPPNAETSETSETSESEVGGDEPGSAAFEESVEQPGPREPQVVLKPVPTIDELPEPIVIEADAAATDHVEETPVALDAVEPEAEVVWTSESTGAGQA